MTACIECLKAQTALCEINGDQQDDDDAKVSSEEPDDVDEEPTQRDEDDSEATQVDDWPMEIEDMFTIRVFEESQPFVEAEIDRFVKFCAVIQQHANFKKIKRMANPLAWWKENQATYPLLARLARIFLSMPVSEVSVESAFSHMNGVITKRRASLNIDLGEDLCLLSINSDVFDAMHQQQQNPERRRPQTSPPQLKVKSVKATPFLPTTHESKAERKVEMKRTASGSLEEPLQVSDDDDQDQREAEAEPQPRRTRKRKRKHKHNTRGKKRQKKNKPQ